MTVFATVLETMVVTAVVTAVAGVTVVVTVLTKWLIPIQDQGTVTFGVLDSII